MIDRKPSRRDAILHSLLEMLEQDPGARLTTAGLAKSVGVTEAALYRHFPSKRKMFEAVVAFAEDAVFTRCQKILQEQSDARVQVQQLVHLVLVFAERNPGVCMVLTGDALMGENDALCSRASRFFERLETQIRQIIKDGEIRQGLKFRTSAVRSADWVMVFLEGRIERFIRSAFVRKPSSEFEECWPLIALGVWA